MRHRCASEIYSQQAVALEGKFRNVWGCDLLHIRLYLTFESLAVSVQFYFLFSFLIVCFLTEFYCRLIWLEYLKRFRELQAATVNEVCLKYAIHTYFNIKPDVHQKNTSYWYDIVKILIIYQNSLFVNKKSSSANIAKKRQYCN